MLEQVTRYFEIAYRFNYLGATVPAVRAQALSDFQALLREVSHPALARSIGRYLATAHNHPVIAPSTG